MTPHLCSFLSQYVMHQCTYCICPCIWICSSEWPASLGPVPRDDSCIWADCLTTNTWLCRNKAMHRASCCLTLSLVSVCVSVDVRRECLQGCQRRFKIFSLLSAPTHFSLCTTAQICKSISSECRAPDQLQFIPFSSVLLSALTIPLCSFFFLLLYTHPPPFSTVFILPLVFCLLLAALFMAYAPTEELYWGVRISTEHLQEYGLATKRSILSI